MPLPAILTLVACVIGLTISVVPLLVAGTAVLMIPITVETGWSRGQVSTLMAVALTCIALGTAIVGRLIALWGPRKIIVPATLLFAASLAAFATSPSYGWALVLAAVAGLTGTGASQFAYINVLPLWFDRRLGLSLGIAMLGIGLGNAIVPIVGEILVRVFSWREIYFVFAALVLFIAFPNALLLLRVPRDAVLADGLRRSSAHGLTARQALRGRQFWQLALCFFLATAVMTGVGIHLTALMTDRGYDPADAARVFSLWGVALLLSRCIGGILLDYVDARWIGGGCILAAGLGAMLLALGARGLPAYSAVVMIAMAHGLDGDLVPYLTRRYFGLHSYGTIFGMLGLAFGLGPPVGLILIGQSFDRLGNYTLMLWITAGTTLLCALLLVTIGRPVVRP